MTYSIVARDGATGEIGAAVQSCHPWVGAMVIWARAGVGAVATQALSQVTFGPAGLDLLAAGRSPTDALAELVASDDGAPTRQVSVLDRHGRSAAHTGAMCVAEAGHLTGDGWAVAANMMERATAWAAMADAFVLAGGDLAHRLLAALDAAEAEGGDMRGRQSAALLVVGPEPMAAGLGASVDVRVDDHPAPLDELRRLVDLTAAYTQFELALARVERLDLEGALDGVGRVLDLHPALLEARIARLSLLLVLHRPDQARAELDIWSDAIDRDRLALVWHRMIGSGLVPLDPSAVDDLLAR